MRRFVWCVLTLGAIAGIAGRGAMPRPPAPILQGNEPANGAPSLAPAAATDVRRDHAAAAPLVRSAATANRLPVRVVAATSGEPLAGIDVQGAVLDGARVEWTRATSATDGAASLPAGAAVLAVAAPGWAPVLHAVPAGDREDREEHDVAGAGDVIELALAPAAALTIHCVDAEGAPVPGVEVRLLPPLHTGPGWDASWRDDATPTAFGAAVADLDTLALAAVAANGRALSRGRVLAGELGLVAALRAPATSDTNGSIHFVDLPPGADYRVAVVAPRLVELEPPHESSPLRVDASGVRTRTGNRVHDLSGAFPLAAGERRELTFRIAAGATLTGRIVSGPTVLRPQVKLYHCTIVPPAAGRPGAAELSPEARTVAGDDGAFRFDGVRPGTKVVRAYWRTTPCDYGFTAGGAQLDDGATADVGALTAADGTATIRVELCDRAGRTLIPDAALVGDAPRAIVHASLWQRPGRIVGSVQEAFVVPLGEDVRLHGLGAGTLRLRAVRGIDWPDPPPLGPNVRDAAGVELQLPHATTTVLVLPVEQHVERDVVLAGATAGSEVEAWLRPVAGGEPERVRAAGGTTAALRVRVLPEPYLVCARQTPRDAVALVGTAVVDFAAVGPATVALAPGGTVHGRCRSSDGRPFANGQLAWCDAAWGGDGRASPYRATTDAEGGFVLHGLPPGASLRGTRPGTDLRAPAAGAVATVELTLQRAR